MNMCDRGKKDRANRNGTTRNGPAPASRGCHYLPVDCQNLKCYNGSASQVTHDGQSQKGVGKCNGVETNIEKLARFIVGKGNYIESLQAFSSLIKVCVDQGEKGLGELQICIGEVSSLLNEAHADK